MPLNKDNKPKIRLTNGNTKVTADGWFGFMVHQPSWVI